METIKEYPDVQEENAEVSWSDEVKVASESAPFAQCLAEDEMEVFSPQDIEDDEIISRALGQVGIVESCVASAGRLRRNSAQAPTSMTAMLKIMKSLYSSRRSTMFIRDAGHFDTTLQMIEALRGLGTCLREIYENELDQLVQTEKCRYIVEQVSRIPNLIKTILLLKNEDIRRDILSLPIMTRVLLCKYSVLTPESSTATVDNSQTSHRIEASANSIAPSKGCWLMRMLKNPSTKEQGVQYLEIVSSLTVTDYMRMPVLGTDNGYDIISLTPTKEDTAAFKQDRMELFQAISSNEKLILRLFTLTNKDMERAGITAAVRFCLSEAIYRPFMISLVFCDFLFHMILLIVYRQVVFHANEGGTRLAETVNSVGLFCIVYFMFRLVTDLALIQVSWHVFWRSLSYIWSVIELSSTLMAIVGWILIKSGTSFQDRGRGWFVFQACTIGLLWLRVLGFLQVMNRTLAAYVHSMFEILRDMGWFVIITVVVIFGFGDMFFTIYSVYRRPDDNGESICQNEQEESPFCSTNRGVSYLTIYRVFVGDIQVEEFAADRLTVFLFVVVTFFGVIVLLNMLIAIVTTSYEGSHRRSDRFFGRARIALVGKGLALEQLMRPRPNSGCIRRYISVVLRLLASVVLMLVCAAVGSVIFELLNLLLKLFSSDDVARIISAILASIVATYLWVILMVYLWTGWGEQENSCCVRFVSRRRFFNCCVYAPVRFMTLTLLGAKPWRCQTQEELVLNNDKQTRQLSRKKKTNLAVFESWSKGTEMKADVTEQMIAQMENERRTELSAMEKRGAERDAKYRADLNALERRFAKRDAKYQSDMEAMERRIIERDVRHKADLEERDAQQVALLADRDQRHKSDLREMERRIVSALKDSATQRSS